MKKVLCISLSLVIILLSCCSCGRSKFAGEYETTRYKGDEHKLVVQGNLYLDTNGGGSYTETVISFSKNGQFTPGYLYAAYDVEWEIDGDNIITLHYTGQEFYKDAESPFADPTAKPDGISNSYVESYEVRGVDLISSYGAVSFTRKES